jgi:hypothetical protein
MGLRFSPWAAAAISALALTVSAAAPAWAEAPTRAEYVAQLERECKPGSEATRRAVHGVRADVRAERFAVAAAKFARARRIFTRTVTEISAVPRPEADVDTLSRWFTALRREERYLGRIVKTLRASNVPAFQRAAADFIRQGNRANNVVVSFGFNYCSFKPSRFQ